MSFLPTTVASVPSTLISGITSVANSAAGGLTSIVNALPSVPQYYFTVPFPNNQLVLYKLQISSSNNTNTYQPTSNSFLPVAANSAANASNPYTYVFPLSPSSINKTTVNLVNYFDVNGGPNSQLGVQRIVDQYGTTPPIITISGTTGFQFHSLDGFQWSGKSSFALLVQILRTYVNLVNTVVNSQQPQNMPQLFFYDGWTGEVFQVVPFGNQAYLMDTSRPIIQTYNLQLLVVAENSGPQPATNDPISQALVLSEGLLSSGFLTFWNSILTNLPTGTLS